MFTARNGFALTERRTLTLRKTAVIAAILSLGLASAAAAGDVAGTVYDQRGLPVAGVVLAVDGQEAVSAADGSYRIADVSSGDQMVSANGQRVSVSVAEEGTATRNIFLLSRSARSEVTGGSVNMEAGEEAFAEALELAEQMLEDESASRAIAWRWNDLEA